MFAAVVIPACNEPGTVGDVTRAAQGSPWVSEVLVVDDGSRDETSGLRHTQAQVVAPTPHARSRRPTLTVTGARCEVAPRYRQAIARAPGESGAR